jgi:hypothetical protein
VERTPEGVGGSVPLDRAITDQSRFVQPLLNPPLMS